MFREVLRTEFLKLRRSRVTWLSLLAYSIGPAAGGLFMWIAQRPGLAARLGLLGTKANIADLDPSWTAYLQLLVQTTGVGGMLLLSVVTAYVFGREYSERTARNMLALPVRRDWFVAAKLLVILAWMLAITAALLLEAAVIGSVLRLPGLSSAVAVRGASDVLLAALVTYLLVPPVAWVATLGRGYLPPLGFALVMLIVGNVLGATGWGKWFPWSIVPLFAGVAGPRTETLAPASLALLAATFAIGIAATIGQIRYADYTG
jgi:ABC-2 type transport system permease protein